MVDDAKSLQSDRRGGSAYLMVKAEVPVADREAFDVWYEAEHLPDAKAKFKALSAQRGWSTTDPGVHFAFYEFPDTAAAEAASASEEIKALIAEFDRCWQDRVKRTREIISVAQQI